MAGLGRGGGLLCLLYLGQGNMGNMKSCLNSSSYFRASKISIKKLDMSLPVGGMGEIGKLYVPLGSIRKKYIWVH